MKIIELILDEDQDDIGVEAISIVESPAIESDFVALKNQEIKLAEVDKEKKILMGALLIPNKPIYRNGSEGEYYIYFSKDTIVKASQMFLQKGNQSNSTLEHAEPLSGLTLVESWIVESKEKDKSAMYGLDVPVGTWMGSVKVNNDEVWNEYVKSNKVKGFSIEGYFADKMEAPKEKVEEQLSEELLSKIKNVIKNKKVDLSISSDARTDMFKSIEKVFRNGQGLFEELENNTKRVKKQISSIDKSFEKAQKIYKDVDSQIQTAAKELGVAPNDVPDFKKFQSAYFFIEKTKNEIISDLKKYQ